MVLVRPGPKWISGKPVEQQALQGHGRYLEERMKKAEHDPGVMAAILTVEWIRPFYIAFDAASGKSPFNAAK